MYPPPQTNPIAPLMPIHLPTMRVTFKGITFSREAAELLGATDGTRVSIEQEKSANLYLYVKVVPLNGYKLIEENRRLTAYSRSLARRILNITGSGNRTALFRLGEPTYDHIGTRIVPIITSIDYVERNKV